MAQKNPRTPAAPSRQSDNTWLFIIFVVLAAVALGFATLTYWRLMVLEGAVTTLQQAPSFVDTATALNDAEAAQVLAEVERLNEQVASAVTSFNSLIGWTQFVGIAVAIIAAVVAVVGFRNNTEDRAELQQKLADAESKLVKIDETIEDVQKLREANAAAQIGQRQLALDNLREAFKAFERAMKIAPDDPTLQYLWAESSLRLNGTQGAEIAYKRLKRLHNDDVDFPSASAMYAYAARLLGDDADDRADRAEADEFYKTSERAYLAVKRVDRTLLDSFGESVYGGLAGLYRRRGNRQKAIDTYRECLQVTPLSSYVLNNLALLEYCDDSVAARERFEKCLKIATNKFEDDPNDYWSLFDALTARIALNQPFEALQTDIEDAITLSRSRAGSNDPLKKFLSGLGELQCASVQPIALAEAERTLKRALREEPRRVQG
jgi:tetratricopeptide (TPR) repeat protein